MKHSVIPWPDRKKFAFSIIDDTDNATIENITPVYNLLDSLNLRTTKTVWVYPPRDSFKGTSISDGEEYLNFIKSLIGKGFDIELHGVGSGSFQRDEIVKGIEKFKELLGRYPQIHINHSQNPDNLFWGYKRFVFPLRWIIKLLFSSHKIFKGDDEKSKHFWGDIAKKHIKYIRNHVFNEINTQHYDNLIV